MTDSIKIRKLKVVKKQEIETETETGTSTKWTYQLQDEEKENVVTLKTESERDFELGDTLDVTIGNDQTTIEEHVQEDINTETETIKEIEEELDLNTKEGAVKAGQKKQKMITEEDLKPKELTQGTFELKEEDLVKGPRAKKAIKDAKKLMGEMDKIIENKKKEKIEEGVPAIPASIKTDLDKLEKTGRRPPTPETHEKCKFYYRGGLCANSKMDKPFCVGDLSKCTFWNPEEKKEKGSPDTPSQEKEDNAPAPEAPSKPKVAIFVGDTVYRGGAAQRWQCPDCEERWNRTPNQEGKTTKCKGCGNELLLEKGTEKARKKREPSATSPRGQDLQKERDKIEKKKEEDSWRSEGDILVTKKEFPKDILGGLQADVKIELNMNDDYLFAHAKCVEKTEGFEDAGLARDAFKFKLEELSGVEWTWVMDKTFNASKKQLNREK